MLKYILTFLLTIISLPVLASSADFSKIISDSNIKKSDISISVINTETGKEVYQLHSKKKFYPGSVQKLLTYKVAEYVLGRDYRFKTSLYKNSKNEYLIKLGADPLLTSDNLKVLATKIQPETNAIYIDDSILDDENWGNGWDEEDNLNPSLAKFSAYNLDNNIIKVLFIPNEKNSPATISQEKFYPLSFINEVITGDSNKIELTRKNYIAPDMIIASGTVNTVVTKYIPITNTKRYFKLTLERILNEEKIDYSGLYKSKKLTPDFKEIAIISHGMDEIGASILKNGNNISSETVFKVAAAKTSPENKGTFNGGLKLFYDYCKQLNIDTKDIKIADASGVSDDNILTAEFITTFLANKQTYDIKQLLPTSGEGVLNNRMSYMKGKLFAQTGAINQTGSIAGYVDTLNGNTYAFCIIINDESAKNADKKMLEEYLIREIFTKL